MKDQRVRLYIIKGVPESTVFEPQTRKEISVCNQDPHLLSILFFGAQKKRGTVS